MPQKIAIVTGGRKGIGRACAEKLHTDGYRVIVTGRNADAPMDDTGIDYVPCDNLSILAIRSLADKIFSQFGRVDVLVNNAGITKDNLMLKMTEEDFEQVIDTNLKGAFLCIKHVSKIMLKQKRGHIINISSVVGVRGNAGQVNYASSKAGLIGMTKSVAKEIGSRGITVNAVAPGFIETDMTAKLPEAVVEENLKSIPMKKLGKVEDVANLVRFLASDDASYITGQVICVDGGMAM